MIHGCRTDSQGFGTGRLERAMNSDHGNTQPELTPVNFGLILVVITIVALVVLFLLGT